MTAKQIVSFVALAVGVSLWTGCATTSSEAPEGEQYSGFLGDYSALEKTEDAAGDELLRYVSPKIESGEYHAVLLEPTQYYPSPAPSERVSAATLEKIRSYVEQGLRNQLDTRAVLVSKPGPGVLRIRSAITAVAPQTPGLKPYQYIPIAFVVTTVKGRGEVAALNLEFDVTDSVSGERIGASVRHGTGEKLAGDAGEITLGDVQPLLDRWIDNGSSFVVAEMRQERQTTATSEERKGPDA